MTTSTSETEELERLRDELARERRLRIDAEAAARSFTWLILDEISRKLPLLLAWVDRDCRFHFANERYAALFGQTPQTILSMTLRDFYGETIWNRIEGHVRNALAGQRVEFDVNDPALEDPCLFRVTYVPDRGADGQVRGFFLSLYDVKEVRRAERASAFLAAASHILAGTLDDRRVLDEITRLTVPRLADWCFVDYVDEEGGTRRVAVAHPPDADPDIVRRHARYFAPKEAAFNIVNTARSGMPVLQNHVDDELIRSVARDEDHLEILRAVGMRSFLSVPLTARERTFGVITFVRTKGLFNQDDLQLATDLGRRVAVAIDNNRLYAEAQDANRAKDDFLATLSHELRTPLTAILGWASALRDEAGQSPLLQEGLSTIQRSARIQAQLVDDVLDVSRIVSGKLRLEFTDVDFAADVDAAREQVESMAAAKRVAIDTHGPRPAPVVGDRMRLEQVVWNLLANAVKFSGEGSTIRVRWSYDEAITLEVSDEGEGIEADVLPHIFDRFRQADSSTT
ncbi:MAG TPA: PAS domain-containing sensor histidine kinase, partial [Thermoanaerobaculia bacterium]|nr:PAS domain-containing sensor histidine kinase [Thermoanaerobaculia bacterium]